MTTHNVRGGYRRWLVLFADKILRDAVPVDRHSPAISVCENAAVDGVVLDHMRANQRRIADEANLAANPTRSKRAPWTRTRRVVRETDTRLVPHEMDVPSDTVTEGARAHLRGLADRRLLEGLLRQVD